MSHSRKRGEQRHWDALAFPALGSSVWGPDERREVSSPACCSWFCDVRYTEPVPGLLASLLAVDAHCVESTDALRPPFVCGREPVGSLWSEAHVVAQVRASEVPVLSDSRRTPVCSASSATGVIHGRLCAHTFTWTSMGMHALVGFFLFFCQCGLEFQDSGLSPSFTMHAVGVDQFAFLAHSRTASVCAVPGCMTPVVVENLAEERESPCVLVGHGEEAGPAVRSAESIRRGEDGTLNNVPCSAKISLDCREAATEQLGHVLDEDDDRLDLGDDAEDVGPDPPLVLDLSSLSCAAKRLARDACREDINEATPREAVEGSKVVPHSKRRQDALLHTRRHHCGLIGFPLHHAHGSEPRHGEGDPVLEREHASAQGKRGDVPGARSHTYIPPSKASRMVLGSILLKDPVRSLTHISGFTPNACAWKALLYALTMRRCIFNGSVLK
jgi:hypothetical protein